MKPIGLTGSLTAVLVVFVACLIAGCGEPPPLRPMTPATSVALLSQSCVAAELSAMIAAGKTPPQTADLLRDMAVVMRQAITEAYHWTEQAAQDVDAYVEARTAHHKATPKPQPTKGTVP
ncbi:MAG TPA: hypothetical protein VMW52_11460 [Phycisphaerae bacterium]|nr:hypothetical protein [Phycisphaerae bacterium]